MQYYLCACGLVIKADWALLLNPLGPGYGSRHFFLVLLSCQSCLGEVLMHMLVHIDVVWFLAFLQVEEVETLVVETSTDLDQLRNPKDHQASAF